MEGPHGAQDTLPQTGQGQGSSRPESGFHGRGDAKSLELSFLPWVWQRAGRSRTLGAQVAMGGVRL